MTTFINDVLRDLKSLDFEFSTLTFIVPSKRAGVFIKNELSQLIESPIFSPVIISIEEFVVELSRLKSISNTELLFEFYNTYKTITANDSQDSFESFSKWAQILLQDFNEIDRYLIPEKQIFEYLSAIQEINHWSLETNQTELVSNYLSFWNKIKLYYDHLKSELIKKGVAYQGLIYREAVENIQNYIESCKTEKHVFIGFNALNTSEEIIIQELLQNNLALIYWDIDKAFFNNKNHDAGMFVRKYHSNWKYYKRNPFKWILNNYDSNKNINVIGIPKNVGQSKHIGSILKQLHTTNKSLNRTAVILGEESLLLPVLSSIPKSINALNITMGLPLKSIPLASLFQNLFLLHKKNTSNYYFKDVINILSHPFISPLLAVDSHNDLNDIVSVINKNNLIYLTKSKLDKIAPNHDSVISILFSPWENDPAIALKKCQTLILRLKEVYSKNKSENILALEYLFQFNKLFNELTSLNTRYNFLSDISSLFSVYNELLNSETLDFKGEPLEGLQIMGMLESRVLDFETVIISSVNEGVLPSGKSQNTFIPYDVKLENNLPTYKEKDAVYTYHFYRLLQRAQNVYILYNTEIDPLSGGEKSRFITQLELIGKHKINHSLVVPKVPTNKKQLVSINKTNNVLETIKAYAEQGFSPSALSTYIRNPLDFYLQKVLKINEYDDIEETIAANTLGTVIHNTLEDFYKPFEGKEIHSNDIKQMKPLIDKAVSNQFKKIYKEGDINTGKNLIVFEITKRYISNFLDLEIRDLEDGNRIEIISIEADCKTELKIADLDFPVFLKGKVDRLDKRNDIIRIIDYKSGKVEKSKVEIMNWEDLTTDYDKYSKSFQILSYALMMGVSEKYNEPVEAGIISFKNLNEGFMRFAKKQAGSRNKDHTISYDTLKNFTHELKTLIIEICNPEIPFIEKETN